MLTLDKNDWKTRLFRWALSVWDEFRGAHTFMEDGTNLCFFVRTICVWMPMVLALHLAVLGAAIWCVAVFPITAFGVGAWLLTLGGIALFFGACYGAHRLDERAKAKRAAQGEQPKPKKARRVKTGPSAWSLIWLWLKSQKRKVCPEIRFDAKEARRVRA